MRCVICHGSKIEASEVNEESKVGNDIVYVPVKVFVCQTCGERYYDRRTIQFLEETERKLSTEEPKLKEIGKVLMYD